MLSTGGVSVVSSSGDGRGISSYYSSVLGCFIVWIGSMDTGADFRISGALGTYVA